LGFPSLQQSITQILRGFTIPSSKTWKASKKKQVEEVKEKAAKYIEKNYDSIVANSPVYGDVNAKYTIVQFSDYNCGYCKAAHQYLAGVVAKRPDIKIVVKELPILGKESADAAKVALFIYQKSPAKYQQFHTKMLSSKARESAVKVAVSLGFKDAEIKAAIANTQCDGDLKANYKIATELGIGGTPSFIVGQEFVPSFMPPEQFDAVIEKNFK